MEFEVHHYDEVDSTQSVARELALSNCPEGTVVLARYQRLGRGRLHRRFVAEKDSALLASIILRPSAAPTIWSRLSLLLGVVVAEALKDYLPQVRLKWPNDIWMEEKKLGGILCEVDGFERGQPFAVCGLGINLRAVDTDVLSEDIRRCRCDFDQWSAQRLSADALWKTIQRQLETHYDPKLDGQAIVDAYYPFDALRGEMVRVQRGEQSVVGRALGLNSEGALRVGSKDGELCVFSGEVNKVRPWSEGGVG